MPDQADKLIQAFGLGNGQRIGSNLEIALFITPDTTTESTLTLPTIKPLTIPLQINPLTSIFSTTPIQLVQRQASLNRCPGRTGQTGLICTDAPYNTRELSITFIII